MAPKLACSGPPASLLIVLAVLWALSALTMAVMQPGMPPVPRNTTTSKYYGFEGGGRSRTRSEEGESHSRAFLINASLDSTTPPLGHRASAPRSPHTRDSDNDSHIREYFELTDRTSNFAGHIVQSASDKLGLLGLQGNTPPTPRQPEPHSSSTLAHVGVPRRQVVAPADFTLTPSLRLLLQNYSSTPHPPPSTTEALFWPVRAWRGRAEGERREKSDSNKFCRVVEDFLVSLARGGTTGSTPTYENLQTAAGQLLASILRETKQKPDNTKTSDTTTTITALPHPTTTTASTAARLLLLHMDGSPVKGALLPTQPYKGKMNGS